MFGNPNMRVTACVEGQHRSRINIWQNLWKRRYCEEIQNGDYSGLLDPELSEHYNISDLEAMLKKYGSPKERGGSGHSYYAVTINPPSLNQGWDKDLYKLEALVTHLGKLVSFPPYVGWSYDQRSDDPTSIHGVHVHIMVEALDKYPSDIITTIFNCMKGKKHYGSEASRTCIHVKPCDDGWLDYVKGLKTSDKDKVVEVTRLMHTKAGVMRYYTG